MPGFERIRARFLHFAVDVEDRQFRHEHDVLVQHANVAARIGGAEELAQVHLAARLLAVGAAAESR